MNVDEVNIIIRKMAKSSRWQAIYSNAKELKLKLFENELDLTELQVLFLNYLSFYSSLYMDIAMGDVAEFVTDNFIYEDAYMYYKRKCDDKNNNDLNKSDKNKPVTNNSIGWLFKSSKKEK